MAQPLEREAAKELFGDGALLEALPGATGARHLFEDYGVVRDCWIKFDPEVLGGTPVVVGTRVSVCAIRGRLPGGDPLGDLVRTLTCPDGIPSPVCRGLSQPTRRPDRRGGKPRPRDDRGRQNTIEPGQRRCSRDTVGECMKPPCDLSVPLSRESPSIPFFSSRTLKRRELLRSSVIRVIWNSA